MRSYMLLVFMSLLVRPLSALPMQRLRSRSHPQGSALAGNATGSAGRKKQKTTVWLSAFARSGSSTLFALIEHAGKHDEEAVGAPFEIYEPCHYKNELEPQLLEQGCDGLMRQVLDCNFAGIKSLRFALPEHAEESCKGASLVLYKTVNLTSTVPLLESMKASSNLLPSVLPDAARKNLRVIELIRDPRGIYASWVGLREFRHNVVREPSTLTQICDVFAANLELSNPNVHRVVFEDFVRRPSAVAKDLLVGFLGLPYGAPQQNWIRDHFEVDCGYGEEAGGAYRLCQNDPESHIEKWRDVLNNAEMNAFTRSPACRRVAKAYNYTLDDALL